MRAMKITFAPVRGDTPLQMERDGEVLILNGVRHDLSGATKGNPLPAENFEATGIAGEVTVARNGRLNVTVFLPHGNPAPKATRFPKPITVTENGPVSLPAFSTNKA